MLYRIERPVRSQGEDLMPTKTVRSEADILPEKESTRFGLSLSGDDFKELGDELSLIGAAERSVEVDAAVLRVY